MSRSETPEIGKEMRTEAAFRMFYDLHSAAKCTEDPRPPTLSPLKTYIVKIHYAAETT